MALTGTGLAFCCCLNCHSSSTMNPISFFLIAPHGTSWLISSGHALLHTSYLDIIFPLKLGLFFYNSVSVTSKKKKGNDKQTKHKWPVNLVSVPRRVQHIFAFNLLDWFPMVGPTYTEVYLYINVSYAIVTQSTDVHQLVVDFWGPEIIDKQIISPNQK